MNELFSIWIKGETEPFYTGDQTQVMMFGIDLANGYPHGHVVVSEDIQVVKVGLLPTW